MNDALTAYLIVIIGGPLLTFAFIGAYEARWWFRDAWTWANHKIDRFGCLAVTGHRFDRTGLCRDCGELDQLRELVRALRALSKQIGEAWVPALRKITLSAQDVNWPKGHREHLHMSVHPQPGGAVELRAVQPDE